MTPGLAPLPAGAVATALTAVATPDAGARSDDLDFSEDLWLILITSVAPIVLAAAVLVYLIRRGRPQVCARCGRRVRAGARECPRCGEELRPRRGG